MFFNGKYKTNDGRKTSCTKSLAGIANYVNYVGETAQWHIQWENQHKKCVRNQDDNNKLISETHQGDLPVHVCVYIYHCQSSSAAISKGYTNVQYIYIYIYI